MGVIINKRPLYLLLGVFSIASLLKISGACINVTPSMPEGVYIRAYGAVQRGDSVAFCLPEPFKSFGIERAYIYKGTKCDGSGPMLKKIIAVPGDNVTLTDSTIIVNGVSHPFKSWDKDSQGRPLKKFKQGNYFKTTGYWMIGTGSLHSWDSRYWGPIKKEQIFYRLKLVLAWPF